MKNSNFKPYWLRFDEPNKNPFGKTAYQAKKKAKRHRAKNDITNIKKTVIIKPQQSKITAKQPIPICPLCGEKRNFVYTGQTSIKPEYGNKTTAKDRHQIMRCNKCSGKFVVYSDGLSRALVGYSV